MNVLFTIAPTVATNAVLLYLAYRWMRRGGFVAKAASSFILFSAGYAFVSPFAPDISMAVMVGVASVIALPVFLFVALPITFGTLSAASASFRRDAASAERERVAFLNER